MRRVVVTGLGAVSPCGNDAGSSWDNVVAGRSGVGPLTAFDASGWAVRIAAQADTFTWPVVCDGMANNFLTQFGAWPTRYYIVQDGVLKFKIQLSTEPGRCRISSNFARFFSNVFPRELFKSALSPLVRVCAAILFRPLGVRNPTKERKPTVWRDFDPKHPRPLRRPRAPGLA